MTDSKKYISKYQCISYLSVTVTLINAAQGRKGLVLAYNHEDMLQSGKTWRSQGRHVEIRLPLLPSANPTDM